MATPTNRIGGWGLRLLASFMAVGAALAPAAALAQEAPPTAIIVFDGSNSMNGRIPGDPAAKHVLVREAVRRAWPKLAPGARLGLAAFGHRRQSDCTDAGMVLAPSADQQPFFVELERFKPRGFSPVALALREAAAPLANVPGPVGLLLVLDDLASCRTEDPCVAATDLAAKNPRLTISVLGLALNQAAAERMTCVANAARGRFANIQDAREINAALESVLAASTGPLVVPTPNPPARPGPAARDRSVVPSGEAPVAEGRGLYLSVRLSRQGPVLDRPVRWRVMKDGAAQGATVAELDHASAVLDLEPGRYSVEARIGGMERKTTVEVSASEPTLAPFDLDAGLVHVAVRLGKGGGELAGALVTAHPQGDGQADPRVPIIAHAGGEDLLLPAGTWRLVAEHGLARSERLVTLKPGDTVDVEMQIEAGIVMLAVDPPGGNVRYAITEDDPDSPDGRREIARSAAPAPTFVLPVGAYNLIVRRGVWEVRERVVVRAGEETRRRVPIGSVRLRVTSRLPGPADRNLPVTTRVIRLDGAEREIGRSSEAEAVFELTPGRYRIEARVGGQNAVVRRELDVRTEGEQRLTLDVAAGSVQLRSTGAGSSLQFGEVFWTILDPSGQPVWRTGQPEPLVVLAAGRYVARVEARGTRHERAFEIRAGDAARLDVGG